MSNGSAPSRPRPQHSERMLMATGPAAASTGVDRMARCREGRPTLQTHPRTPGRTVEWGQTRLSSWPELARSVQCRLQPGHSSNTWRTFCIVHGVENTACSIATL
jgi:hypothetical protein